MNGGPEYIRTVLEYGMPAAPTEGRIRYLGDAGLVPRQRRGRPSPKNTGATWDAPDFARAILAEGAILPVDAANAVRTLSVYCWVRTTKHQVVRNEAGERARVVVEESIDPKPDRGLLHDAIADFIRQFAMASAEDRAEAPTVISMNFITLSIDEGFASISYQYEADRWEVDEYYAPERTVEEGAYRWRRDLSRRVIVKLPLSITVICGNLLAQTWASSTTNLPSQPSGEASASAAPEP